MSTQKPWLAAISARRHGTGRSSTATWIAEAISEQIADGLLRPGDRLSDQEIAPVMEVSRNTVREAFQILVKDRLLEHKFNRGMFVNKVPVEALPDLYSVRRLLECAGVRAAASTGAALDQVEAAVLEGEHAAEDGRWDDVGTADIKYHRALAGLLGSPRVDEMIGHLLVEMRLVFHEMDSPREFHEPYLARNRRIHDLMAQGDFTAAEKELRSYLDDAETQLTTRYREKDSTTARP
ncbi:DNA-binding GntR family transcriptional regulator [Actinomadura pelletieri DSM 43383]|uniref:DNA-binding GntR family transcriptional regulator n=1 Tax=Actinomadura pelletieri DSM 43383 TaxID=1120940 RepID=A0A495QAW5_9ACTN|nr:GntR family transcriptional regulator [Actinomadura pelletieri]RKS68828.1 DNA-binding GntR family transcriptional regulator [Actinomadura pelletieri DSM 43383]